MEYNEDCDKYDRISNWTDYIGLIEKVQALKWELSESDKDIKKTFPKKEKNERAALELEERDALEYEIDKLKEKLSKGDKEIKEAQELKKKATRLAKDLKVKIDEINELIKKYGFLSDSIRDVLDGAFSLVDESEDL